LSFNLGVLLPCEGCFKWGQVPTEWWLIEGFCEAGAAYAGPSQPPRDWPPLFLREHKANLSLPTVYASPYPEELRQCQVVIVPVAEGALGRARRLVEMGIKLIGYAPDHPDFTPDRRRLWEAFPTRILCANGRWSIADKVVIPLRQAARCWPLLNPPIHHTPLFVGRMRPSREVMRRELGDSFEVVDSLYGLELAIKIRSAPCVLDAPDFLENHYWSNRIYLMLGMGGVLVAWRRRELVEEMKGAAILWAESWDEFRRHIEWCKRAPRGTLRDIGEQNWRWIQKHHRFLHRAPLWFKLAEYLLEGREVDSRFLERIQPCG